MENVITLTYPVTFASENYTRLTMRRMKVADAIRDYGADKQIAEVGLFADLCNVAPDVIHELDMVDYDQLQTAFLEMRKKPSTPPNSVTQ